MNNPVQAVVIGTSTGGLAALRTVLSGLDRSFRPAILVVQHRLASSQDHLVELLSGNLPHSVMEAEEKQAIEQGTIYIAPANYHLLVESDRTISLSVDPRVTFARPSIDVLFESASDAYRNSLVGVLLTGANHDGTNGMLHIRARGGVTIAQNPATAESPIMPASAIQARAVDFVLDLDQIASTLTNIINGISIV